MKYRPETSRDKHGYCGTRTYRSWQEMLRRCLNPGHKQYPDYGARGISVCFRWRHFPDFLADMGAIPDGMFLDRINNDAGYYPSNCRWATRTQQNRNTRANLRLSFRGEIKVASEWAEIVGIPAKTVYTRLKRGWPVDQALTRKAWQR